ncbi:TPA: hypothetical protein QCU10_003311 [Bacillus anthracis]|uniref:hypothetical protein n=1 Tax=Bacillus anthracis TaxID=1392 RepID=UPI0002D9B3B3|nr:hypothetical protein [Bacillus cereus]HDR4496480.1 hypothetical protein [Bacillus cereus biovar anthracis]HDR6228636.1 hypothetical protein [Bacillus cereus biovar anthracis]HDR6234626.1 hypothetical protein [Bacillus cereus biovar anthracis]HDR6239055.1 hypothetical protein [Bacillus cereus biovar anthracis]HDR6252148.1 hypothetical protein [Bacillus cereus biovar anthracis]
MKYDQVICQEIDIENYVLLKKALKIINKSSIQSFIGLKAIKIGKNVYVEKRLLQCYLEIKDKISNDYITKIETRRILKLGQKNLKKN